MNYYYWLSELFFFYIKDVLDLAWSPDDSKLATCSIDNTIRIWDAQNLPGRRERRKGHKLCSDFFS